MFQLLPSDAIPGYINSEARPFKSKDIDVAKLFSKHFKLAEHVEYLDKTKVSVAVAAPNRIGKLLSETSMSCSSSLARPFFPY